MAVLSWVCLTPVPFHIRIPCFVLENNLAPPPRATLWAAGEERPYAGWEGRQLLKGLVWNGKKDFSIP